MSIFLGAIIPAILIATVFYLLDERKEPLKVILTAFYLGMLSVLVFVLISILNPIIMPEKDGQFFSSFVISFYHAGFLEEVSKFVVFLFGIYYHKEFDERYDGILYGVLIGLGFAFIENILFFNKLVPRFGEIVFLSRGIFSMPLHALVCGMMGYYLAMAKFTKGWLKGILYALLALVIPIFVHGFFDFVLFFYTFDLRWLTIPIVAFMWIKVLSLKRVSQRTMTS
jgi:RsiW-degrading membrane proteinase PrsW (M82 family)